MMDSTETATNLQKTVVENSEINDEKSRRHPRWTRQETLTLIQAKDIAENSPIKGRKMMSSSSVLISENTEPKWVMISTYCKRQGVSRGPAQCRKRWSNLIGDYRKIKSWELKVKEGLESFWVMRNDLRKENKLPVSFDMEVFKVLSGREMNAVDAVSPLPLQAVAAAVLYDQGDVVEDEGDLEDDDDAVKGETDDQSGNLTENETDNEQAVNLEMDDVQVSDSQGDVQEGLQKYDAKAEDKKIGKRILESPVKTPEADSDNKEQHHQEFHKPNGSSSQAPQAVMSDVVRESRPGISYCYSPEKEKRRRVSDPKANKTEAQQILRILEANNAMLNAQLEMQNKSLQLDREERKENNGVLVAALGRLTDVLAKIADKLELHNSAE